MEHLGLRARLQAGYGYQLSAESVSRLRPVEFLALGHDHFVLIRFALDCSLNGAPSAVGTATHAPRWCSVSAIQVSTLDVASAMGLHQHVVQLRHVDFPVVCGTCHSHPATAATQLGEPGGVLSVCQHIITRRGRALASWDHHSCEQPLRGMKEERIQRKDGEKSRAQQLMK
jgi:hypothetical protein